MATDSFPSPARVPPDLRRMDTMRLADAPASSSMAARRLSLARHQVFTIKRADGIRAVKILRGTIWLTGTPADRDVLLSAEDYFVLGLNAPFILEALADAEIILNS